jgi:hypothetical protein
MIAMLKPIMVTFDGAAPYYDGFTTGRKWNGYECPLFERGNMEAVLRYLVENGHILRFRFSDDGESIRVWEADGFDTSIGCTHYTRDGETVCLYNPLDGWCFIQASATIDDRPIVIGRPEPVGALPACWFCGHVWGECSCRFVGPGFDIGDMIITEPHVSECGRFFVNPIAAYGEPFIKWIKNQPAILNALIPERINELRAAGRVHRIPAPSSTRTMTITLDVSTFADEAVDRIADLLHETIDQHFPNTTHTIKVQP